MTVTQEDAQQLVALNTALAALWASYDHGDLSFATMKREERSIEREVEAIRRKYQPAAPTEPHPF